MIGRRRSSSGRGPGRRAVLAALATAALGVVAFGARPADPIDADPTLDASRRGTLMERARAASDSLSRLEHELRAAVDRARRGAARVVAGDEQPGIELAAAAARLDAARPAADLAASAVRALRGTADAAGSSEPLPALMDATPDALASIAAQLRGTIEAANDFSANRRQAEAAVAAFGDALAVMHGDDPARARQVIERAAGNLEAVAAWEPEAGLPTLGVWLATMEALLDASRRAAQAALAGDRDEAAAAVRDWELAAEDAHQADLALGIAMAEGGSLIAAAPLQRLAAALAELDEAEGRVASLVQLEGARSPSEQAGLTR